MIGLLWRLAAATIGEGMTSVFLALLLAPQGAVDLSTVLARASEYVSLYEAELGNLIGAEEYLQTSVLLDNSSPPRVVNRTQRRTSSDFLIIQVGTEWAALRKINRVDGVRVKETVPTFEDAFDDSPAANAKRLENMKKESTEYNLGYVRRDINLPTFALRVLRKSEVARFAFERAGAARIEGVQTWRIRFHEQTGPSLVSGGNGETLYSRGTLWIEPETGRVLQTEFELENPYAASPLKGRIAVTYDVSKRAKILVPTIMVERYESAYNTIDCRADYSNFRPFEVDVKFEIRLPQP
jgi:hypothetical protein